MDRGGRKAIIPCGPLYLEHINMCAMMLGKMVYVVFLAQRWRQEYQEVKVILSYGVSLRLASIKIKILFSVANSLIQQLETAAFMTENCCIKHTDGICKRLSTLHCTKFKLNAKSHSCEENDGP